MQTLRRDVWAIRQSSKLLAVSSRGEFKRVLVPHEKTLHAVVAKSCHGQGLLVISAVRLGGTIPRLRGQAEVSKVTHSCAKRGDETEYHGHRRKAIVDPRCLETTKANEGSAKESGEVQA